jgi:hypothetical protein
VEKGDKHTWNIWLHNLVDFLDSSSKTLLSLHFSPRSLSDRNILRKMCRTAAVKNEIQSDEKWIEELDINAFATDITALGKKLEAEQGKDDVSHLNKMIMWSNICAALGLLTMGIRVNLFSIIALSTFTFSRWTMIAHHTCK